jgi:hypothetical protein
VGRPFEIMDKFKKIIAGFSVVTVVVLVTAVGAIGYFFSEKVITSGEAYGFKVGATRSETFASATQALQNREGVALHVWPEDQFHRDFLPNEDPVNNKDPRWVLVIDPTWWNNTVTLSFKNDRLVEIRRDRYVWELP